MPRVVFDGTESEELRDLRGGHGVLHILLVGKDENGSISQSLWTEEPGASQPVGDAMPRWDTDRAATSIDTDSVWNASQAPQRIPAVP